MNYQPEKPTHKEGELHSLISRFWGSPLENPQRRGSTWHVTYNVDQTLEGSYFVGHGDHEVYEPMTVFPAVFSRFAEFGEEVWRTGMRWDDNLIEKSNFLGMRWDDNLIEKSKNLHFEYGSLYPNIQTTVFDYWLNALQLALMVAAYRSLSSEHQQEREKVIERIMFLDSEYLAGYRDMRRGLVDSVEDESFFLIDNFYRDVDTRLKRFAIFQERHSPEEHESYVQLITPWITGKINHHLNDFQVLHQLMDVEPGKWRRSYKTFSLGRAMWVQVANIILGGSDFKDCENPRCPRESIFASTHLGQKYCSKACYNSAHRQRMRIEGKA